MQVLTTGFSPEKLVFKGSLLLPVSAQKYHGTGTRKGYTTQSTEEHKPFNGNVSPVKKLVFHRDAAEIESANIGALFPISLVPQMVLYSIASTTWMFLARQ